MEYTTCLNFQIIANTTCPDKQKISGQRCKINRKRRLAGQFTERKSFDFVSLNLKSDPELLTTTSGRL